MTGNMAENKQCSYSFRKAIKEAKCWYRDKVESQFNGSDRDVCGRVYTQSRTTKGKTATSQTPTSCFQTNYTPSLPAFRIIQCHRRGPLQRTAGSPSPSTWQTWVRHLNVLHGTQTAACVRHRALSCTHLFCPPTQNAVTQVKISKQNLNQWH